MSTESSLHRPVRGTLEVNSPAAGQRSEVLLDHEPVAVVCQSGTSGGGLEFDILDLGGAVLAHGGDGRLMSIVYPVFGTDGVTLLELHKTWRPTRVRVMRPGQAELRLRLGHRQPWSSVTDVQGLMLVSILEDGPGVGSPVGFRLKLGEPVLSVVQAVAMVEFASARIGALRTKMN